MMNKTSRPHDETMVDLLREDPLFVNEYLAVALDEVDQPGGREALLTALRHVAKTRNAP
jgi:DNA-binding phage protein